MAEIFGTELVKGKPYTFHTGAKVAIFTWQGCTVELKGKKNISYIARETPMVSRPLYMIKLIFSVAYVSMKELSLIWSFSRSK